MDPAAARTLLPAGFDVALRGVDLGGVRVRLFQVRDPNALADALDPATFAIDERFPYWAELWPAALALARFLWHGGVPVGGAVLELGCGTGLAGVTAALLGGRVLFTDYEPHALAFASANHALNLGTPGETRLLDWRAPPAGLRADLVLAADVLYEQRFLAPLLETLRRSVAPGGRALVAEPNRDIARGTVESLEGAGFRRELHLEEMSRAGRTHAVWVHELFNPSDR